MARDLLSESGSIFVQIGDENVHRVRTVLDEVFGEESLVSFLTIQKTSSQTDKNLSSVSDYILWFAKDKHLLKFRRPFLKKDANFSAGGQYSKLQMPDLSRTTMTKEERSDRSRIRPNARIYRHDTLTSQSGSESTSFEYHDQGRTFGSGRGFWKTNSVGWNDFLERLVYMPQRIPFDMSATTQISKLRYMETCGLIQALEISLMKRPMLYKPIRKSSNAASS